MGVLITYPSEKEFHIEKVFFINRPDKPKKLDKPNNPEKRNYLCLTPGFPITESLNLEPAGFADGSLQLTVIPAGRSFPVADKLGGNGPEAVLRN